MDVSLSPRSLTTDTCGVNATRCCGETARRTAPEKLNLIQQLRINSVQVEFLESRSQQIKLSPRAFHEASEQSAKGWQ
jgi:hypothetical protein